LTLAGELLDALDVPVDKIGIGFPGPVDFVAGVVRSSVMVEGWSEVPLAALAKARFGVPVVVDNDVNAAALAELQVRGGVAGSMVMVAVGTGIGGAITLGDTLWRGASSVAGEIGHVVYDPAGPPCPCGRNGCVNLWASGAAIGDDEARAQRGAEALGSVLASVINVLNPELVVIGGGVAERGESYLRPLAARARAEAFSEASAACRIEKARAGYTAGAYGAALLTFEGES
jgi:glucokinase